MKSLVSAAIHVNAGSPASRRPIVRLLGLAPAILLLTGLFSVWAGPLAVPVAAASGDWTQFRNGPTHSGYNTTETTLSPSNVAGLGVAWTGATGSNIYSSPAVADGVVYVGSRDGNLYAYAVGCNTGGGPCTPLWTATAGDYIDSSPAVANGVVYVGSFDHMLYAFDAAGIAGCSGSPKTCTPLWTATTGGGLVSSPAVANGVVYVGSQDGKLYAFDAAGGATYCTGSPKTCTPLWTATTGNSIYSSPAVADGVAYVVSSDKKLYAYAVGCNTGGGPCTPLWTATTGDATSSSPAVADGVVYVGSGDGKLYAYAVGCASGGGTCTPLWTATTGYITSPAVADGVVYVGSNDGKLYAYAVGCASGGGTCTPLWTAITSSAIDSSPAVANGVVYVVSWDGKLYAYAVGCASGGGTCTPLWTGTTGSYSSSSPAVANGVVYVGSSDAKLYAYGLDHGTIHHLVLSPATSTIAAGASQAYTAEGFDSHNNSLGDVTSSTTFTIAGGGSCTGASCTSAVPGDHTVTGTDGTATGTATLHALAPWTQFRNDPTHGGYNATETTLSAANAAALGVAWTGATPNGILSSPAVANGVVYVGSTDGKLYAYAVGCASGGGPCTPLWTATTGGYIDSSPAVADGVVYVGSNDHKLNAYAVGCNSGGGTCTPLWTAATGDGIYSSSSSPAVADGVVYVGSTDGKLYAFAVGCASGGGTCTPLWTATTGNYIGSSPAVADGVVYVGSNDKTLYAFAVGCADGGGTCTPLWTATTGDWIKSSPAVANGVVYVGSYDHKLYAYAVGCNSGGGSCSPLWTATAGGYITSSPAVANGVVYVGSNDGKLYAYGLDHGTIHHLVLSPATATIAAGASQAYTAEGFDASSNSLGDVTGATTFTISGGGSCTGASCTSTVPGDHTVIGTDGSATGAATLHVDAGTLDHLVLSPSTATIAAGGSQVYTAQGADVHGNSLGDLTSATTFTIAGGGSCTAASCTSTVAGDHTVTGTDGSATGTATLHVNAGAIHHLVLSPSTATIAAGTSQAYTAEGFDASSNSLGDVTISTTFTIAGGGSCTAASCTSTVPGGHTVTGTDGSAIGTATLHVNAGALHHLVLSPATATIAAGGSQAYTAEGFDSHNNSLGDVTSATTFTISGGGSCSAASCTSTVTGDHTVTGTDGSATGTATLHVNAGTIHHLVLSPATATIAAGASQAYTAEGFDASSNSLGSVTSATTFTISGGGSCTAASCASTVAGDHTVTGTDGSASGTATLHMNPVSGVSGATYHALPPTRILDSRNGTGLSGVFSSHVARTFTVTGHGGVPAGATAVTGNLTVTQQTSGGFLSIGPVAQNNPTSSTLNFPLGDDRANAVTVALSGTGTLSATYAAPTAGPTAHVIFDVTGYFTPDATGATYHALTPGRILDSRDGTGLAGVFSSHVARTFTVTGHGGVPAGATAVTGNLTVTGQNSQGFLFMGPNAADNPTSSTLNFPLGDDRANAVTVALGAGGTLSITYAAPTAGKTAHVIFDVTGFFTGDMTGAVFVPLTPSRILDSRDGTGGLSGAFGSHVARPFTVIGHGGVPSNATAVTGNLTVTQQTSGGFLYLGPVAADNPTSSTLNFPLNDDRANAVTVALGAGGTLSATYAAPTSGPTAHVIFDATGYFVP